MKFICCQRVQAGFRRIAGIPSIAIRRCANLALLALLLLSTAQAWLMSATTLQEMTVADMIRQSTSIVRATIVPNPGTGSAILRGQDVYTLYGLEVLEQIKPEMGLETGMSRAVQTLAIPGGIAGGLRQLAPGSPVLKPGQEYVLFLWKGRSGLNQLIGLTQGLFSVSGNSALTQAATSENMLNALGQTVGPRVQVLTLPALRAQVIALVMARAGK